MTDRKGLGILLALIGVFTAYDIFTDLSEGASGWHLLAEGAIVLLSFGAVVRLWRDKLRLRSRVHQQGEALNAARDDMQRFQNQASRFARGLGEAIDQQMERWELTTAEKEVALLLLKGLSLKEIAAVRNTSEKTVRAQTLRLYTKSGLSGRAELSAFFLEDLLVPQGGAVGSTTEVTQ